MNPAPTTTACSGRQEEQGAGPAQVVSGEPPAAGEAAHLTAFRGEPLAGEEHASHGEFIGDAVGATEGRHQLGRGGGEVGAAGAGVNREDRFDGLRSAEGDGGDTHAGGVHDDATAGGAIGEVEGGALEEVTFEVAECIGGERAVFGERGFEFAAILYRADAVFGRGGSAAELLPFERIGHASPSLSSGPQ